MDTRSQAGETHPIYFIDQSDYEHPVYVVASGLWSFVRFLLESEIALWEREEVETYWPFDRGAVLEKDPAMALYDGEVPLPWETV